MKFILWIGNPYKIYFSWSKLKEGLGNLLAPVIKRSKRFDSFEVNNVKSLSHVESTDLLVYLVPSYPHGFIGRGFGPDGSEADRETGGQTLPHNKEVCAEVYAGTEPLDAGGEVILSDWATGGKIHVERRFSVQTVACLLFHEALHVKTGLDNKGLHKYGGLASEVVPTLTVPTESDVRLLSDGLDNKHQPKLWIGGFADVANRG